MKKIFKVIAVVSVVLLVGSIALHKQCDKPLPIEPDNEFKLPVDTYRPPLVRIPFKKGVRMPVERKNLPIPIKDIDKTIEIGNGVVIVIDKKGKIYTTKDTPKDIPIKVTVWKQKLLAFESKWGAILAMTTEPDMYFCLSWSFFRVGGVHVGVDVGIPLETFSGGIIENNYLLGVAGRYRILKNNEIYLSAGYEFTHKTVYVGIMVMF